MSPTSNPPDWHHFEQLLQERVPVLRAEIRDTLLRADAERYADMAARVQDAQDHGLAELLAEVSHAEVERDLSELRDIQGALHRITVGTYGQCIQCAAPIPRSRLEAWPTAKRCLPCQQQHEQARQRAAGP